MSAGDGQGHGALLCPHHPICSSCQHLCTSHHQFVPGDHTSTTFTSRVHQADPSAAQNPLKHPKPKPPPHFCILILLLLQAEPAVPSRARTRCRIWPRTWPWFVPSCRPARLQLLGERGSARPPPPQPRCAARRQKYSPAAAHLVLRRV